jgi:hypothetical protein
MAENKGLLGGGNLLPKILILIAVGLIISVVIFGIPLTIPDIIWTVLRVIIAIGILAIAIKILENIVFPNKGFSPTESWNKKLVRVAEMSIPPRTTELWMRGEDMHTHYFFGKLTGLLFIPKWAGVPIVDAKGKFLYTHKHDREGKPVYDQDGKPVMVNQLANITEKEGDWLFVVSRGWIPAFAQKVLVRADIKLCSDIGEKVWVKTVNLVPTGDYFYPHQQWQSDIVRINMQHLAETVQETHMHFLDLCATTTESSLRSDPMFVRMMSANTENITQKDNAPIQSLGGGR